MRKDGSHEVIVRNRKVHFPFRSRGVKEWELGKWLLLEMPKENSVPKKEIVFSQSMKIKDVAHDVCGALLGKLGELVRPPTTLWYVLA